MPQRIMYGEVEILHIKSNSKMLVFNKLFKEMDNPEDSFLIRNVLSDFKANERDQYKILRLCTDTAKHIGDTVY